MLRLLRIWPSLGGSCASLESLDLSVFGSLGRHKNPLERAQILNSPRWGVIIRPADEEVATKRGGSICRADNDHYRP